MFKKLVKRIFTLILNPQKGWREVCDEMVDEESFNATYLNLVVGLIALSSFVGTMWLVPGGGFGEALRQVIVVIFAVFFGCSVASYLLNRVTSRLGISSTTFVQKQFVVYSSSLIYLLLFLMPLLTFLPVLWLVVFYSLHIIYIGAKIFYEIDDARRLKFSLLAFLIVLLTPTILFGVLNFLIEKR